ncbi:hypothetical protein F5Y10DRAFT_286834 [Nemania abortiva]|nr:hypothetical protein F5Y10DRAFT_286834 [Nemania abortiva]
MDALENENGLPCGMKRCTALFEDLLANLTDPQASDYLAVVDSHKRFQAWICSLLSHPTDMADAGSLLVREVVESIERNLSRILEIEIQKERDSKNGSLGALSMDFLSVVSDLIEQLEDFATELNSSQKLARAYDYDRRRAAPPTHDDLVIRGLILTRFPEIDESILQLLEISVVARRKQKRSCDWCHDVILTSKLKDSTWWRKHFLDDLQPYVCLAGCEHPRMFFSGFHEWQDHMDWFHGEDWIQKLQRLQNLDEWRCDFTSCPSEQQIFSTSRELRAHFHLVHGKDMPVVRIDSMPKKVVESLPDDLNICPLCHQYVPTEESALVETWPAGDIIDNSGNKQFTYSNTSQWQESSAAGEFTDAASIPIPSEGPMSENSETRGMSVKHIANHLKSLAFISLRDIGKETTRVKPSDLSNRRKDQDDISEDSGSDVSLPVHISGQLQLGDILTGPLGARPIAINRYDRTPIDNIYIEAISRKGSVEHNSQELLSKRPGIWANLLASLGIGLDLDLNIQSPSKSEEVMKIKSLETHTFNVRDDYVKKVLSSHSVVNFIDEFKPRVKGGKEIPFYMVSGLKVARGASLTTTDLEQVWENIGTPGSTDNTDAKLLEALWKRYRGTSFETSTDFVLAFQVTHIKYNASTKEIQRDMSLEKATMSDGMAIPAKVSVNYVEIDQDYSEAREPYQEILESRDGNEILLVPDLE